MDVEEELTRDVFAQFGLAAYWGQRLENTLVATLALASAVRDHAVTVPDLDSLELAVQKKTMGVLLHELRSIIGMPSSVEADVDKALDRRNFLTHHFFRERAGAFTSVDGKARMIEELRTIGEAICQADKMMVLSAKVLRHVIAHDAKRQMRGTRRSI